jgi:hypothetical protein
MFVLFALGVSVVAQQPTIKPGDILVAAGDLNLRDRPPHGWFYTLGDAKSLLRKGEHVKVQDQKTIKTLFGEYQWAKVTVLTPQTGQPSDPLWVFVGEREEPLNLRIIGTKQEGTQQ